MLTKVVKRNKTVVDFDWRKIEAAVSKAFKSCNIEPEGYSFKVAEIVRKSFSNKLEVNIDEIQDKVESTMMDLRSEGLPYKVTKKYILYRDRRDKDRNSINKLATTFHDVINIEDNNILKSNANINGYTPAGQMLIFGTEASKEHACTYIMNPKFTQAHKLGFIHVHDLDYYSTKAANCNHIDLLDLFNHNYIKTNESIMRKPKRISSFAAQAAIALQSEQNEMFGGQSICNWDYAMAEGVKLSFKENFYEYLEITKETDFDFDDKDIRIGSQKLLDIAPKTYKLAYDKTIKDVHEAMASFVYSANTMHSRAGNQVVFSSINYGTDDSIEGRIVIDQTLNAIDEGSGDGSTFIFPISVFKVKDGVNFSEEDWELAKNNWQDAVDGKLKFKTPNFDLFIKSCVVSAHRLFPNFLFLDTPFNQNPLWKKDDPNRYKYELATMGCRTRVYDDLFGEKTCVRRGNLSFTTLNLPRLAIESRLECINTMKEFTNEDVIKIFYSKLDYYLNLIHDQLLERFNFQCSAYGIQFPFITKNRTLMGSENVGPHDKMYEVFKHGTLSIGFIGLAETLVELIGKHHGESDKAQKLGLEIIKHMRDFTDKKTQEDHLNFSLFSTPAEGLSGRFTLMDKKKYGIISGVTDKDYYTNSSHIPVSYHISAFDKIKKEAPYHALTNAGHIMYVEEDGDPRKNTLAFASVVVEMKRNNIGYGAINHAVDRCEKCGYEGQIEEDAACPKCGENENISHLRRITGYLSGSTNRWNSFKLAELKDRVKHL